MRAARAAFALLRLCLADRRRRLRGLLALYGLRHADRGRIIAAVQFMEGQHLANPLIAVFADLPAEGPGQTAFERSQQTPKLEKGQMMTTTELTTEDGAPTGPSAKQTFEQGYTGPHAWDPGKQWYCFTTEQAQRLTAALNATAS